MTTDSAATHAAATGCVYNHFDTRHAAPRDQLLAWRDRLDHFLDVPISRRGLADGFSGTIDSYRVGDLAFMDCRTDPVSQTRSVARISTDSVRQLVFHVAVEGTLETGTGLYPKRTALQSTPGILALDMNQPMRMTRSACRVLAFFLPRELVESVLPEAESIHGSVVDYRSPLGRLIPGHLANLCKQLPTMSPHDAYDAIHTCAMLIAAAFGKDKGLSGNARAAARTAMFATARRYIDANLGQPDLTLENVLAVSQLSRPTLYRLFESEGGLAAYIRNRRLREAADELHRYPRKAIVEVAYGLGFNSASDFNRAFRRAYDMSPSDFRTLTR
ncbi:Transcriptional regulator, AraC family [Paraburkholderia ribeironis]|uniref:Transcriptional regulator, AraC family n=1 Tax=Paraburkholderia ribeironis TaxID=1247936 RepID=A0A1N7S2H3_9BURK|nr:helix-turn-helix domain-containing protein [Paraburkholderia ribeironis]SIT41597.1 Transcriptional regulator, AraC family [Paraburkholderia ribeironis]